MNAEAYLIGPDLVIDLMLAAQVHSGGSEPDPSGWGS